MQTEENISLKKHNTFGIDVKADYYASLKNIEDIRLLLKSPIFHNKNRFILGGGSNILFTGDFHGVILSVDIKGIRILESNDEFVILEIGAGENWHEFVQICLKNKYYGLENLALIPGKVGAAPVQNIGAYGVEQKEFFHSLTAINIDSGEEIERQKQDCAFAYRNSIFKNDFKNKFIITSVRYKLNKHELLNLSYKELEREISKFGIKNPDARYVFDTVCRLRRRKLPDPAELGNAGSFFKNPVIENMLFEELKVKYPEIPVYTQPDGKYKLSAGWLIEQSGWKGYRHGDAGVYAQHALILVNYGNATGKEILALADEITDSVLSRFGIALEKEVLVL